MRSSLRTAPRRSWTYTALVLTGVCAFACSTLERRVFFAPSASSGVLEREPMCPDAGGVVFSGPADQIVVGNDRLRLEVQAPIQRRDVSVGPFYLPIVPVFFLGWFFPSAFGIGNDGQPLRVDLRIVATEGLVRLDADAIVATVSPAGVPERVSELEDFVSSSESPRGGRRSRGRWSAHFGPRRRDVDSFRLEVPGLRVDGRALEIPAIEFQRARGWIYCDNF